MLKKIALTAALISSVVACGTTNRIESSFVESDLIRKVHSGDILVKREGSFQSGLIARINGGDYSHCAVFIGNNENEELALINMGNKGLIKKVFSDYGEDATKLAVLRFEDQEWSARAAEWLLAKVGQVEYDYNWDISDSSKWFCCEAIMVAFAETSYGKVNVPYSSSDIGELYNTSFAKLAGFKNKKIITPSDFLNDPRFSMVLELEKPSRETDYYDAIFEKVFEWEVNGYENVRRTEISGLAYVVKFMRSNFGFFSERMERNTPLGIVELGIRYHELSGILKSELENIDDPNSPLSEKELRDSLEKLREEDKLVYEDSVSDPDNINLSYQTLFHHFFRPSGI